MLPEIATLANRSRRKPHTNGGTEGRLGPALSTPVPILMFHAIAQAPAEALWPGLYLRPDTFQAQMQELAARGYHAVTMRAVYDHWQTGDPLPSRPVVISFDDGHRSVYVEALPVLAALGWPAVLNLDLQRLTRSDGIRSAMVRELVEADWELDSHTLTHPDLTELRGGDLDEEVRLSRRLLRAKFGVPADFFCYPSGRHDARVVKAVRSAGYLGATTTRPGLASPSEPFRLRRVRIDGADDAQSLLLRLDSLLPQPPNVAQRIEAWPRS